MSMWEPFTEPARRMVVLAQEEAQRVGSGVIGTEHLLLGILAEGSNPACELLVQWNVTLDGARAALGPVEPSRRQRGGHDLVFADDGKKAIEYAFEVAREVERRYIGPVHFLVGILRLRQAGGAKLLESLLGTPERFEEFAAAAQDRARTEPAPGEQTRITSYQPSASAGFMRPEMPTSIGEANLYGACLRSAVALAGPGASLESIRAAAKTLYEAALADIRDAREP